MGATSDWDAAVIARLKASAPLVSATVGIYAGVGEQTGDSGVDSDFPYVVVEDTDFLEYHTSTESGFEILMRIFTFSRSPGRKETRDIQDLIYDALHRQHSLMSVPGHSVLLIDREGSTVEDVDADGSWRGICEYRALMMRDAAD